MFTAIARSIARTAEEIGEREFILSQRQQFLIRLALSTLFLVYLAVHAPAFAAWRTLVVVSWALHVGFVLVCMFVWLPRRPRSVARVLLAPAFDIYMVAMASFVDGGLESPLFFLYLSPTIANGMRYGTPMLGYCLALSLLALIGTGLAEQHWMHPPDWTLLGVDAFAISYISTYARTLLNRAERRMRERLAAEASLGRLLDHGAQPTIVVRLDPEPTIVHKNLTLRGLLPDPTARCTRLTDLFVPDDAAALVAACRRAIEIDAPTHAYARWRHASRDEAPVEAILVPITIGGGSAASRPSSAACANRRAITARRPTRKRPPTPPPSPPASRTTSAICSRRSSARPTCSSSTPTTPRSAVGST